MGSDEAIEDQITMRQATHPFQNKPVISFLRLATLACEAGTTMAKGITAWMNMYGEDLGIELPRAPHRKGKGRVASKRDTPWPMIKATILEKTARVKPLACHQEAVARIGKMAGLEKIDIAILDLALLYKKDNQVENLWDCVARSTHSRSNFTADNWDVWSCFLGFPAEDLELRFLGGAPLIASGFITIEESVVCLLPRLRRALEQSLTTPAGYQRRLLGLPAEASLEWSEYQHLGQESERVRRILEGALESGTAGINILVYGPPGTGKTEFCKAVAAQLKAPIYAICEADEKGRQPEKEERTGALALFQKLVGRGEKALLLFDEAEDVLQGESALSRMFGGGGRDIGSRAFFYRLLENTPVPVLWTANAVDGFGDAILRRMTYALEIRIPPTAVRARLWRRSADRVALPLSEIEISGLAQDFETAPALGVMAVTAAKLAGGDVRDIRRSLTSVARLMSRGIATAPRGEERYDPRLINADHDLVGIAECLQEAGAEQPFSMCLSGPPGTGKSAYAAYLAERLGLPILRKRGSDLFGMYVGETEKNIAQAFAEAEATGALLLFDEADSFLSSRQLAHRSWEVSQVNEMLTWMERHPLPFICTTNLVERLDEAAARRFLIKAHFDFLDANQRAEAFLRFFDVEPPMGLDSLTRLTPADFALVRRKAQFLGASVDPLMLVRLLRHENALKSKAIGSKGMEPATTKYGT